MPINTKPKSLEREVSQLRAAVDDLVRENYDLKRELDSIKRTHPGYISLNR